MRCQGRFRTESGITRAIFRRSLAGTLLLLTLPSALHAACTPSPALAARLRAHPDAESYAALGNYYGEQHKLECAAESFQAALKLQPSSPRIAYMLGLSLYSEGKAAEAVSPLQRSTHFAPEVLKPHLLLAAAYEQLQKPQEARTEWQAALKIDPKSPIALDGISKSLMAAGDYSSVVDNLKPSPHDENITLDLAYAYEKMGMLDQARATLADAIKVSPSSVRLSKALVSVMVQQTRYQEASKLAEKIARLRPHDVEAQADYLRILVLNGDVAIARPLARTMLAANPHNFDFLYLSGILERQAGEFPPARTHLEEAITLNPNYYNAHYNLGAVLAKLGDPKGAREQFEKALELGGTEAEIHFDLAGVLRTLGETELAKDQLKIYQQELKDKSARTQAATKSAQAAQELATGDPKKAVALYQEAVDALPQSASLLYELALAQDKAGDPAGERATLEKVIKIDPTLALAQNQLGYLESQSGDPAAAEQQFKLALRAAPNYTQAWVSLAATLGMESRFPEAQEALANALKIDPDNSQAKDLAKALTAAQAQR